MKISQQSLNEILKIYNPECRYLLEAQLHYPEIKGEFLIPKPFL